MCRMLRSNKISCVNNDSFTGLSSVRLLSLYDNLITSMSPGAFDTLHSLSTLWVSTHSNNKVFFFLFQCCFKFNNNKKILLITEKVLWGNKKLFFYGIAVKNSLDSSLGFGTQHLFVEWFAKYLLHHFSLCNPTGTCWLIRLTVTVIWLGWVNGSVRNGLSRATPAVRAPTFFRRSLFKM